MVHKGLKFCVALDSPGPSLHIKTTCGLNFSECLPNCSESSIMHLIKHLLFTTVTIHCWYIN